MEGHRATPTSTCEYVAHLNGQFQLHFTAPLYFGRDAEWSGSPLGKFDPTVSTRLEEQHDNISRRHFVIATSNGALVVTDLGSTNGTYLSEKKLAVGIPEAIATGQVLRLGESFFLTIEPLVEKVPN